MRIQGHDNNLETNAQVVSQNFRIDNPEKILGILRNYLYKDKIRTPIQEYICNARDAMREIGKGNEFEITVPTKLNPTFKVRDFGPGLTPERISNVFVAFGASTKTDSNVQTGGFGIGAKSAWAYTDSFTVVSVVDGTKWTYVAHIGSNNCGQLDLIEKCATKEPNGVEIQIAVQPYDVHEFRTNIFRTIYFWKVKPTLKGELDPPVLVSGERVCDELEVIDYDLLPEYIRSSRYSDTLLAVIDGIPYPIHGDLARKIKTLPKLNTIVKQEIILHFPTGVVGVAANRADIDESPFTIKGLEKVASTALKAVQDKIKDSFAKVKTNSEYIETYGQLSKLYNVDEHAKFGPYVIEDSWLKSALLKKVNITMISCLNRRGHRIQKVTKDPLSESKKQIQIKSLGHIFYNTKEESKVQQNKRVRVYLETESTMILIEPMVVIEYADAKDKDGKDIKVEKNRYLDVVSFDQVIADLSCKDFQAIPYVEPPKVVKAKTKREDAALCMHTMERERYTYTTLAKNTQKWLYVPMREGHFVGAHKDRLEELDAYLQQDTDFKICGMAERALKMVQGDKNFSPLEDWVKAYTPTAEAITCVKKNVSRSAQLATQLKKLKNLKDSFLVDMVGEYDTFLKSKMNHIPEILAAKARDTKDYKEFKALEDKFASIMKTEYPLVAELEYSNQKDEIVFYINAKYAAKKGKK